MNGQIIIVSGTSGSGKTTTCERFAQRADTFWLKYGIDQFLSTTFPSTFGHHGSRCHEGFAAIADNDSDPESPMHWEFGEWGTKAFAVMHEWVAAASRGGCNIILDHILLSDPPVLQDCVRRLQGLPVLFVQLKPPYDVLMERVATRKMGNKLVTSEYSASEREQKIRDRLHRLRPWLYDAVYANTVCDLLIDTQDCDPDQVCERIEQRLSESSGEAFQQLFSTFNDKH